MNKLTTVKLPFSLAGQTNPQNSGIAQYAFDNNTNLKTIEFDFTTANATTDLGSLTDNAIAQLTNIYKMFAAGDNSFEGNGGLDPAVNNKKPTKDKAWLPTTINLDGTINFDNAAKAYYVNFNGIK